MSGKSRSQKNTDLSPFNQSDPHYILRKTAVEDMLPASERDILILTKTTINNILKSCFQRMKTQPCKQKKKKKIVIAAMCSTLGKM